MNVSLRVVGCGHMLDAVTVGCGDDSESRRALSVAGHRNSATSTFQSGLLRSTLWAGEVPMHLF